MWMRDLCLRLQKRGLLCLKGETLLDRAVSNFRVALKNYRDSIGDERELNYVGYWLQQSAELCIKHCLEMNGVRYSHTHSIEDLLDECDENHVGLQYTDEFYNFAPAISKWESKTRYIKNYTLAEKQVRVGFQMVRRLLMDNGVAEKDLELPKVTTRKLDMF